MDFFEKAHVVKKDSSRKEHKSEEALKKKIKQMLFGYKQHDSKLIKTCEDSFDPNKLIEDTSSVSGYSDLNLTNSSNEGDISAAVGSDNEEGNDSDGDDSIFVEPDDSLKDYVSSETDSEPGTDSISNCNDKILTLSDNLSDQVTLDSNSDSSESYNIYFDSSLDVTTDNDLDEFDADRQLANKIIESLQKKGVVKTEQNKKDDKKDKNKKRKIDVKEEANHKVASKQKLKSKNELQIVENTISKDIESYKSAKKEKPKSKKDYQGIDIVDAPSHLEKTKRKKMNKEEKLEELSDNSMSDGQSSDYVSVTVTDMPVQSLSDIIGEYRHPTVRNIPESQTLCTTSNTDLFSKEETTVEDIQIQDSGNTSLESNIQTSESEEGIDADLSENYDPTSKNTDIYDETFLTEDTTDKDVTVEPEDTYFENPIKVFNGKYSYVFVLKHPAELYIHGKVVVKALGGGSIELFGHILQQEPLEVYAPNNNYAFCLKTVGKVKVYLPINKLTTNLIAEGLSKDQAEEIVTDLESYDGIVSLKKLRSRKMDFVEQNMTQTDLFSKINKNVDNCFKNVSEKLGCSLYLTRPYRRFEELSCKEQVIGCGSEEQSRGLFSGGKGVGKSTFLRYCVNRLVSRGPVLLIDLDPGQPELTVAGNISATVINKPLLGPNFTHLKTPNMMLNLGMINTMDNPRRYVNAIEALISRCNADKQLKSMPWLINTMGMTNAMGLKFITLVILQARPTYLVQLNARNTKKNFETHLNPDNIKKLYEESYHKDYIFKNLRYSNDLSYSFFVDNYVDGSVKSNTSFAPRDDRYLNFLAYFGELLSSRTENGLLGITPYEVNLRDLNIGLNVKINDEAVTKVINGKIIALCQLTTLHDNRGKMFTLRDKPLVCLGHGLIRGIDLEKKILYVITPTPTDKLALVDTLVYGDWVPELRGQEKHLPDGISIPYRTDTSYQKRQLMFAPKRRFNPLQLLKMTRNT